ncbi:uncharacterized protein C1orf50 homolog isoform X1 [Lycorma delicatula]|uniref:uncharacterized protein C1orf50 homolog isoform X1 n=1 Tax=Lycorma delicatula TaxID=130591 RepID=UPI003F519373
MKRSFDFNNITDSQVHSKVCLVERDLEPFGHKLLNVSSTFRDLTVELNELAKEVEKADKIAHSSAVNRLELIAEQMKFLQSQACKVVVELHQGLSLNHAACNFKKVPGKTYHLYQRQSGQKYFSMLSPEEWDSRLPHQFLGSFRLENDMTWTPAERIDSRENNLKLASSIINSNLILEDDSCERMILDNK